MSHDLPSRRAGRRTILSLSLAVPCLGLAALGGSAMARRPSGPGSGSADASAADRARERPLAIPPLAGRLVPVSPSAREAIVRRIQPPRRLRMSSSYCLHLLRVHGLGERLEGGAFRSGDALLRLLCDEGAGSAYFGRSPLVRTPTGVRYPNGDAAQVQRDPSLELHRDQTLAAFAELGLPLSRPLAPGGPAATLRDVLRDSVANFYPGQEELNWTALAYGLYLPPAREWENRFGERCSFDELAEELLRRRVDRASCGGTHLFYTLTILARVDREVPIFSARVRPALLGALRRWVDAARSSQRPDGSWPVSWNHGLLPGGSPEGRSPSDDAAGRLMITGHLAEALLYLPEDLAPPPSTLERAGRWLEGRLSAASLDELEGSYCAYAHAACVLRRITFVPPETPGRRPTAEEPPARSR